jgi:hypothetical protein
MTEPEIIEAVRNLIAASSPDAKYFQCPAEWATCVIKRQARQEVFLLELLATSQDQELQQAILSVVR